jgi:hypothetical protein
MMPLPLMPQGYEVTSYQRIFKRHFSFNTAVTA